MKLKECSLSEHSRIATIDALISSMWKDLRKLLLDDWIIKFYSQFFGDDKCENWRRDIKVSTIFFIFLVCDQCLSIDRPLFHDFAAVIVLFNFDICSAH